MGSGRLHAGLRDYHLKQGPGGGMSVNGKNPTWPGSWANGKKAPVGCGERWGWAPGPSLTPTSTCRAERRGPLGFGGPGSS